MLHLAHGSAGTAGVGGTLFGGLGGQHGGLVIGGSLPLLKGDGVGGTGGQAVAQTVAVMLVHQLRLAVHQTDGALVTGVDASAAAITLLLINMNDLADHGHDLLVRFYR